MKLMLILICTISVGHGGLFDNLFNPIAWTSTDISSVAVEKDGSVILKCPASKGKKVRWYMQNMLQLPHRINRHNGDLIISKIQPSDRGVYICKYELNSKPVVRKFFLSIRERNTSSSPPRSSVLPLTSTLKNLISHHQTSERPYSLELKSNLSFSCANGTSRNGMCWEHTNWYECKNGQKVNKSLRCNRKNDCTDGSDEVNCEFWSPKITRLPEPKVELVCGSQDQDQSDMLSLECEFVGHPEPLIKWRKYDGHVPSKCQQISENGYGLLRCPNFKQSDQGAYSCVAENIGGSSESQPRSIAKCKNVIPCNGFRVKNEEEIEHCLECYCSGKSDRCQNIKSKLIVNKISFPSNERDVYVKDKGDIVFIPSDNNQIPTNIKSDQLVQIKYCELAKDSLEESSLLKSYGRNMRIPRYSGRVELTPGAPDIIVQGNGISVFYTFHVISPSSSFVDVRFWPGNWHHLNKTAANREDLMLVLSNVDRFLFRCEYKKGNVESWSKTRTIYLESSSITDSTTSVSYVEKCICPEGYVGLSCESCAAGYKRKNKGSGFVCEKIQCDSKSGYFLSGNECVKSTCSIDGSVSLFPDYNGKCKCKEGFTGDTCKKTISCERGFFRVDGTDECLKCWCSAVTGQCNGSNLLQTEISSMSLGGYNSSNGRNFWLLSSIFSGNRLTSYGGHIKYGLKYLPGTAKQTAPLTVELLTVDEVTLSFTHGNVDTSVSETEKIWLVPMKETFWKKADKTLASRSEFLDVLTKIKAVYVESPYHLSSGKVNLTWVRMTDAKNLDQVGKLASQVEQCLCPPGYTGLSCENCKQGYYRVKNTNKCTKCDCDNCDPVEGCLSCPKGYYRDNPESEKKPVCKRCECNGNEIKCEKDNNNATYCICKPGFTGLFCENIDSSSNSSTHLTIKLSPSKLTNVVVGTQASFNCSYDSGEKMKLSFMKIYRDRSDGPFAGTVHPVISSAGGFKSAMSFRTVLDEDLLRVECLIHNMVGQEVGRVLGIIQSIGTEPVKITNCYSDTTYVKETKSKDLICQAKGSPKPLVTWYVKAPDGSQRKVDTTDGVHSIESVKLNQNNTVYVCEAVNSMGDKDICSVLLLVEKNCDVVHIVPKSLKIEEGETFSLLCRTTANSSVTWSRSGSFLPFIRTVQNKGNLTILNASVEDTGNYTCKAYSSDGKYINQTAQVNVTEKLTPPTVFISKNDAVIEIGDNFEVNCLTTGKPAPTVTWRKLSGPLLNNIVRNKETLTLQSATLENSGIYECEAKSVLGAEVGRIFIEVKDNRVAPKLEVVPSSLAPIEGQRASLFCKVLNGKPLPTLTWFKEENGQFREFKSGAVLEFENISRYDRGIYQCRGRNAVGQNEAYSEIDVLFVPEITVSQDEFQVLENEEISVKCRAIGNPRPKLMWKNLLKGNQKRDIGENDVLASMYLNPPELMVAVKASFDLRGLICEATNAAGVARKEVPVRVLREYVRNEKDVHLVPIGSYHELFCNGCSGKLKWEKLNGPLVGDECDIPNGLMIPSVQIQHNTTYICKCNSNPKFKKSVGIIVTGQVLKFSHEPKSYVVLPSMLSSKSKISIELSFKTNRENGLLLKDENNQLVVYLHKNKIVTLLQSDSGRSHHFSSTIDIAQGVWYTIVFEITTVSAGIIIFDESSVAIEKKTEFYKHLNSKIFSSSLTNLFVGGTKHQPKNIIVHSSLQIHIPSFDGCISRVIINDETIELIKRGTYSENVNLCKRCSDIKGDPCQGKGKCLDAPTQFGFVCVCPESTADGKVNNCPPGCVGRGCDKQLDLCDTLNPCYRKDLNICTNKISSLECRCRMGYLGLTCEKEKESSFCVKGNGYVKLSSKHLSRPKMTDPEIIEMSFSLEKPSGLLLWRGNLENYLSIAVTQRKLEYIYHNQGVTLQVMALNEISLNENHSLRIKRTNDSVELILNNLSYSNYSKFTTSRVTGNIYLGGVPEHVLPHDLEYVGLYGCINYISFRDEPNINFRESALETLNVKPFKSRIFKTIFADDNSDSITDEEFSSDYYL